jgi:hypothetical protein
MAEFFSPGKFAKDYSVEPGGITVS